MPGTEPALVAPQPEGLVRVGGVGPRARPEEHQPGVEAALREALALERHRGETLGVAVRLPERVEPRAARRQGDVVDVEEQHPVVGQEPEPRLAVRRHAVLDF